jgi:hypothetical protein
VRAPFKQPMRKPLWIAVIVLFLLAASGTVAIVDSIPASYASIPDEDTTFHPAAAPRGAEAASTVDSEVHRAMLQATVNRRNRASCSACGVVESMRHIDPAGEAGRQELTIRFRNGETIVLNEAARRNLQLGNRVIVIGPLGASGH